MLFISLSCGLSRRDPAFPNRSFLIFQQTAADPDASGGLHHHDALRPRPACVFPSIPGNGLPVYSPSHPKNTGLKRNLEELFISVNIYRVKLHNSTPLFFSMFAKSSKILEIAENKLQKLALQAIIRFNLVNQRSASRGFVPGLLPIWGEAEPSINNLCEGSE